MMVEDRPKPPAAVAGVGYLQLQQAGLARTRRARRARRLLPPKQEQEQGCGAHTEAGVRYPREATRETCAESSVQARGGAGCDARRKKMQEGSRTAWRCCCCCVCCCTKVTSPERPLDLPES